jgi:hypothetical protein
MYLRYRMFIEIGFTKIPCHRYGMFINILSLKGQLIIWFIFYKHFVPKGTTNNLVYIL